MDAIITKLQALWTNTSTTGKFIAVGLAGAAVVAAIWIF